jgi:carboxyl-terminal processing protease
MKFSTSRIIIGSFIAILLLAGSCSAGFIVGRLVPSNQLTSYLVLPGITPNSSQAISSGGTPQDLEQVFAPFWQSWKLLHDQYVDQPVDDVHLMRGAIEGMLSSVGDDNTTYVSPEELQMFNTQISGSDYEGIGAWVDVTKEYLTIISPMIGSPAEKAGLKSGDEILAIDGEDMTGIDGELVRQKVLGPAGSRVILTIRRQGVAEPFDVEIIRAAIKSSNVIGRMLDHNVAYVQLLVFGDKKTTQDLRDTLNNLMAENPSGLILDLRGNGGGLLDSAIDVASEFIPDGIIAYEQYGNGELKVFKAKSGGKATQIPMVVLINEGSASASEIVAGAIRDRQRGLLIGNTSYGKGSVQIWTELVNQQGAVRITVAKWLTPNKETINGKGLEPDIQVELTEEDFNQGKDPQLQKAIEVLSTPQ